MSVTSRPICGSNGGVGIGAGHNCVCEDRPGHEPLTPDRPHGCSCGALWADACDSCGKRPGQWQPEVGGRLRDLTLEECRVCGAAWTGRR